MTDEERKQAEDKERALRVLLDRLNAPEFIDARDEFSESYLCIATIMESYAALKVAEATKEMYPLDFVIWKDRKELTYSSMSGRYYSETETGVKEFTLYELFEYWKQNISK